MNGSLEPRLRPVCPLRTQAFARVLSARKLLAYVCDRRRRRWRPSGGGPCLERSA